jgi:gamma-D-glutamyl-L-lysine dipeptidyl-peptidase
VARKENGAVILRLALVVGGVLAVAGSARPAAPSYAFVDVSVATVWASPSSPRAIDRPALGNPARVRAWTRSLSTAERRGLVGRIETQALLGERVQVLQRRGAWTRVAVTDQLTPKDRRGYPGWVPSVQLTRSTSFGRLLSGPIAVVAKPTAWLRQGSRRVELSYGTRLPLAGPLSPQVVVSLPNGRSGVLPRAAVRTYGSPGQILRPTGATVVASARAFLGVRYLWGGTAAFGFDCSGLIELVFRANGAIVPRDADAQALRGKPVARASLRPGDLIFYGRTHVHHAALYAGGGKMIEAPNSSSSVRLAPVRSNDWAGAKRYTR